MEAIGRGIKPVFLDRVITGLGLRVPLYLRDVRTLLT